MKNISKIAICAALGTNLVLADSNYVAGFSGSYSYAKNTIAGTWDLAGGSNTFKETKKAAQKKAIFGGAIFLGYRYTMNDIVFGVACDMAMERGAFASELRYNQATLPGVQNHINIALKSELKRSVQFMPSFMLGKQINDKWMLFSQFGINFTKFGLRATDLEYEGNTPVYDPTEYYKVWKTGFSFGVGAEYMVNNRWSIAGSVNYERYPDIKDKKLAAVLDSAASSSLSKNDKFLTTSPRYVTFKISAVARM